MSGVGGAARLGIRSAVVVQLQRAEIQEAALRRAPKASRLIRNTH